MNRREPNQTPDVQHPEDLSVLERRGLLSNAERRRLQMALAASETLRRTHELGHDFDELETACAGDATLLDRVVARTRSRCVGTSRVHARSLAQRALPWLGVASLLLVSAAAGATLWPHARAFVVGAPSGSPSATGSTAVTSGASKGRRRTLPSKSGSDQGDVVTATADAPEQHSVDVTPPKTNPSKSDSDVEADLSAPNPEKATPKALQGSTRVAAEASASVLPNRSAAELFSEANEARRRGDIERARWLYRTLRETHPTAKESLLSHALLARFELQHGAATAALLEFDQYLRLAPAGPLAEESLEGRATAYRQLGMHAQESMAWRELLNRFPGSVYARTAKERMRDLR